MSELSAAARVLVSAARADRPSAAERARLLELVKGKVAAAPAVPRWAKVSGLGGGGAAIAVTAALMLGQPRAPAYVPPALPAPQPVVVVAAPVLAVAMLAPEAVPVPAPRPRPVVKRAPIAVAPPAARSTLTEEMLLLAQMQSALAGDRAEAALEAAQQHAARFPDGLMREEREAVQVLALCQLGRHDDARARAEGFFARWPKSPHSARLRASCAGQ